MTKAHRQPQQQTAKQKAARQKLKGQTLGPVPGAGLPTRSWWVDQSRETFAKTAEQEHERMRQAHLGRIHYNPIETP